MNDLIKREDAAYKVEVMLTLFRMSKDIKDDAIDLFINSIPAVKPKVGKWIEHPMHIECPNCKVWFLKEYMVRNSYCPNCGTKMEGNEEKERASERLLKCGQELKERLSKI